MEYEFVKYEQSGHVVVLTMNQPEMRNPLTEQSTRELVEAIRLADADQDVRAIVLRGAGKAFCAGGDIKEFKRNLEKSAPTLHREGLESTELFKLGAEMRTPLIASVNGAALGGGTGLVAMCHLAVSSSGALFGLTELKLGLVPFVIMPWVRRAVGDRRMLQMMLTAETISAEKAKEYGLVHEVVPPEELEEATMKLAHRVAAHSPLALRLSLESFFNSEDMERETAFDYLSTLRLVSFLSEDLREGASAFIEKRQPQWQGE